MGWSLGEVNDRAVGYGVLATCDHPGCEAEIHRGLAYACNEQHDHDTSDPEDCAGYFCPEHRYDHDHEAEPTGKDLGRDEYERPILDRYYDYTSVKPGEPGMVGGAKGRRFMTNGHFMVLITEEDYTSALALNWRNVTSEDHWKMILDIGDGRRAETATVPAMAVLAGGNIEIGSVSIMPKYVGLLRDFGATEVLIVQDKPMAFVIAPGLAIVSALPNGDPS